MERWRQQLLALMVLLVVAGSAFMAGAAAERGAMLPGSVRVEPPHLAGQFSVFWEAWGLVEEKFVDRSAVDPRNMIYGALEGMLDSLGDAGHTSLIRPEDADIYSTDLAGRFQGIGAELGQKDGYPVIIAPLDDSPAERAGIQAGDILVEVDGQQVAGISLDRVVRMVRGPEGTTVRLTVIHPGEMSLTEVSVVRANIQVHAVSWALIPGTQLAHLRLTQFSATANEELEDALREIRSAGVKALVVDVRSNTGGLLDQAIAATSQFVSGGNVLLEQDAQGNRKSHAVLPGGQAADLPLVVLVNWGTASAAEIFAGAIQDNQRGRVVGQTTFGTGTVLSINNLSDGSVLLLGTSQWLTPNGRQIWKNGIEPDVSVPLPPGVSPLNPKKVRGMTPDQLQASGDAQILKAMEILR